MPPLQQGDNNVIQQACDAALRNDAEAISRMLGCRQRSTAPAALHVPLLQSTKQAQILHQRLFHDFPASLNSRYGALLRALLMVPSFYDTPWSAAFQFVRSLQGVTTANNSGAKPHNSTLRSLVTEIQSFLQQTVASWWEKERRCNTTATTIARNATNATNSMTPRDWILRLTKQLLEPLIVVKEMEIIAGGSGSEEFWMVSLELVSTIVSMMQGFGHAFPEDILDSVFLKPRIRPDRLLPWLSLATDLNSFLRRCDWQNLLSTLQRSIGVEAEKESTDELHEDLPGLMSAIVSLTARLISCESGKWQKVDTRECLNEWKRLALSVLHVASRNPNTFSTATAVFEEGMSALPSSLLGEWLPEDERADAGKSDTPNWIKANVALTLMRVERKSGSSTLNTLLSRAVGLGIGRCDVASEGWNTLVRLANGESRKGHTKSGTTAEKRKRAKATWIERVESILKNAFYSGSGSFRCPQDSDRELLNRTGSLIYQSLFLAPLISVGKPIKKSNQIYSLERANDWIRACNNKLRSAGEISSSDEAVVIVVAFTIVFCDVPMARSFVVRGFLETLIGESNSLHAKADIALLTSLIISTVVSTKRGNSANSTELKPVIDVVVAGKLPKQLFFTLVSALAPTSQSAPSAILKLAQKGVHETFGTTSADEKRDGIQCSLYGLCVLLALPEWTETIADAWELLSDIIVSNRPALAPEARSFLFDCLKGFVESGKFSQEVSDRIFRSCLMRLLSLQRKSGLSDNCFSFCPRSVLTVWASTKAVPTEDLERLFKLLFTLFFYNVQSKKMKPANDLVGEWLSLCLSWCCPNKTNTPTTLEFDDKEDTSGGIQQTILYCKLTICLILAALDFAIPCVTRSCGECEVRGAANARFKLDIDSMQVRLMSHELSSCNSSDGYGRISTTWLARSSVINQDEMQLADPPPETVRDLARSICESVATFIRYWPQFGTDIENPSHNLQLRDRLLGLHNLTKARVESSSSPSIQESIAFSFGADPPCCLREEFLAYGNLTLIASSVICKSLSSKSNFSDTNSIISVTLDHLDVLDILLNRDVGNDQIAQIDLSPLIYAACTLYSSVGDEAASIRLISYFEEVGVASEKAEVSTLGLFLSSDEVDARVRCIRSAVLRLIRNCLQRVLRHGTGLTLFSCPPAQKESDEADRVIVAAKPCPWPSIPVIEPVPFFKNCLENLSGDLVSGLEGKSGGVTTEMYAAYSDCIDLVSELLGVHLKTGDNSVVSLSQTKANQQKLWSSFCLFPPTPKTLFLNAYSVICHSLPRLARCAAKELFLEGLTEGRRMDYDFDDRDWPSVALCVESFETCIQMLTDWLSAEKQQSISWHGVKPSTLDQLSKLEEASTGECSSTAEARLERDVPAVVTVSIQQPTPDTDSLAGTPKMLLKTKEMWSWTCVASLVAMEQVWIDVGGTLSVNNMNNMDATLQLNFPMPRSSVWYLAERIQELASVNMALKLCFTESEACEGDKDCESLSRKKGESTALLKVEAFPSDSKTKLCTLIERMVSSTTVSIELLSSVLQGKFNGSPARFVDALAVTWVWITADKTDGFECVSDTRRWYLVEKNRLELLQGSSTSCRVESRDVLKRFPKLISRMEKLESRLGRLRNILLSAKSASHDEGKLRLKQFDSLLGLANAPYLSAPKGSLKALVEQQFQSLSQARSEDVPVDIDGGIEFQVSRSKMGSRKRRHGHRQPMRSRNQTVDTWLRSDQQYGADERDGGDAFLDLEEFIADG